MNRRTALALVVVVAALLSSSIAYGSLRTFSDVPADHPFAEDIAWMADTGITTGFPDGTFRPASSVTRQSMAAFMHRQSDYLLGEVFTSPLTVAAIDFMPNSDSSEFFFDDDNGYYIAPDTFCAQAPVHLPDGAIVTQVRLFAIDDGAGMVSLKLRRAPYTTAATAEGMAPENQTTGSSAAIQTVTTSVDAGVDVIDNSLFAYQLTMCQIAPGTQILRAAQLDFIPPTS